MRFYIMTVPINNNHLKNSSNGTFTVQTQGGTVVGAGNISSGDPITKNLSVADVGNGISMPTSPKNITGDGVSKQTKVVSGGTFAYDNARGVIRRATTTLAGSESSNAILFGSGDVGADSTHEHKHIRGAMVGTAWRDGAWTRLGISGQRTNWKSSASSYVASGIPYPLWDQNNDQAEDTTLATDNIANPTRSGAGRAYFHFLEDFVTFSNNKKTFSAKNS